MTDVSIDRPDPAATDATVELIVETTVDGRIATLVDHATDERWLHSTHVVPVER